MACEFPKEADEFRFIERMLLHEGAEGFCRVIEGYVVVSFPDHDIEERSILIPGEHSLAVRKSIPFHDAIQKEIDIIDDTLFPLPIGKRCFSVFLMMYKLVSGREFVEDEYFIEKKEGKLFGKSGKENVRLLGEIDKGT